MLERSNTEQATLLQAAQGQAEAASRHMASVRAEHLQVVGRAEQATKLEGELDEARTTVRKLQAERRELVGLSIESTSSQKRYAPKSVVQILLYCYAQQRKPAALEDARTHTL